ncbi:MAG TPA: DUF6491 family protein [Pseudomonadales bacterium]|jgi:hypothetical protein|nr:DUF6491 family protein [Pseudomonadales bacterium]
MSSERVGVALVCGAALLALAVSAAEPTAEEILNGTAGPIDYSQAVKCIASAKIERTEPLNDRYIVFHLSRNQLWLAQLKMRCPGMTAVSQLSFEKDQHRLCEWDSVRTVNEDGIGGFRLGPKCNLPKFEPVSPEQVDMLKQHIRNPGPSSPEPKP